MIYNYKNDIYSISIETGNKSNYLGIKIGKEQKKINIISHKTLFPMSDIDINKSDVYKQVTRMWNIHIKEYYIEEIHFYPRDSYIGTNNMFYEYLTFKLIEYIKQIQNIN